MKIGFIILAHDEPEAVADLVGILSQEAHSIVVHYDAKSARKDRKFVASLEQRHPQIVRVISTVKCAWGEWSLVEAVLHALEEFRMMHDKPDYIHLMSAADLPIRPLADMKNFLNLYSGFDFIEAHDITKKRWVKGGLSFERFQFFFPVNFRNSRVTFDWLVRIQRFLKFKRNIPLFMTPHMGSQWWTLRWQTCEKVLAFTKQNPHVVRYFRSTWIPDESFFQTIISHLIPGNEIANTQLLFHHFMPDGSPYVVDAEHVKVLRKIPHFFVRKVPSDVRGKIIDAVSIRQSPTIPKPRHLNKTRNILSRLIDQNSMSYRDNRLEL
jgi:hypothetical protein